MCCSPGPVLEAHESGRRVASFPPQGGKTEGLPEEVAWSMRGAVPSDPGQGQQGPRGQVWGPARLARVAPPGWKGAPHGPACSSGGRLAPKPGPGCWVSALQI